MTADDKLRNYNIFTIDIGLFRPRAVAVYLIIQKGEVTIIDTGAPDSASIITTELSRHGVKSEQVKNIVITHLHLDHAGGASQLLLAYPQARLYCHPLARRHLANPERLIRGTRQVYGERRYEKYFSGVEAISSDRIITVSDNERLELNGRQLLFLHTPGHAPHHVCIYDTLSRGLFCGDAVGVIYDEFRLHTDSLVFPATTPPEFDLEASCQTVEKVVNLHPALLFLSHYGVIDQVPQYLKRLTDELGHVSKLEKAAGEGNLSLPELIAVCVERMTTAFIAELEKSMIDLSPEQKKIVEADLHTSAVGIAMYIERRRRKKERKNLSSEN